MKSVKSQFDEALRKVVFPADLNRPELRTLCRAMFDAGRRSARNEQQRRAKAVASLARKIRQDS